MSTETEDTGGGEELSIRDSLSQAFEADRSGEGEGSTAAPPLPKPAAEPAPAPDKPAAAAPAQPGRDANGRFTPKPAEAAPAQAAPAEGQPAPQPDANAAPRAPASWTAAAKAEFASLSPAIQAEISRREQEIERGFAQQQSRLEVANRFDALVAPFKDRFAAEGIDPIQGVQRLFAAQSFLEKNPVEGLLYLARNYGVHPARLAQAAGVQQPAQGQAQQDPRFQSLAQQVQTLQSQLSQREQAEKAQRLQSTQAEIHAFSNDPANVYFHNVRDDMIGLLQSGRAQDLKTAYDMAVWANPETRALLQADTVKKAEAERLNAQRQQTNGARRAAGSVTGSPTPGAGPAAAGNPNASIRDELKASFAAHRA